MDEDINNLLWARLYTGTAVELGDNSLPHCPSKARPLNVRVELARSGGHEDKRQRRASAEVQMQRLLWQALLAQLGRPVLLESQEQQALS